MKVGVVGAGYVGLTTAVCLAHAGHQVVCADVVEEKVAMLSRGELPLVEDGLDILLKEELAGGRLRFVVGAAGAAQGAELVFLCVPTPQGPDGAADMSYIEEATRSIAGVLDTDAIVVTKSTVPVGSTRVVEEALARGDVLVVSNPEFLREGTAVHDFLHPDRIVIGSDDQAAAIRVASLYSGINAPVVITDPASAETIKYASNAFLATKVSFVNAMANVCEAVGADIRDVILGIGYDRRIGFDFLRPGPGWGGSCFPKDTQALVRIAEGAGYDFRLLKGVIEVNDEQGEIVVGKIRAAAGGSLAGKKVAAWGLTFKARTDDLRESPALTIIGRLIGEGASVSAFDPTVKPGTFRDDAIPEGTRVVTDPYAACEGAAVLVVLTEWDELKWLDFAKVHNLMAAPQVVDARNLLDAAYMKRQGFAYQGIGRA